MGLSNSTLTHGEVVLLVCGNSGQMERGRHNLSLSTLSNIGEASMHYEKTFIYSTSIKDNRTSRIYYLPILTAQWDYDKR